MPNNLALLGGMLAPMTQSWGEALWRASWQGGLALLVVFIATRCWRRMPPLLQVWLWRLAFLKVLVALAWSGAVTLPVQPPVQAHLPRIPAHLAAITTEMPTVDVTQDVTQDVTPAAPVPVTATTPAAAPEVPTKRPSLHPTVQAIPWPAVAILVWMIGMAWGCGSLWLAWRQTRRLWSTSRAVDTPAVQDDLRELAQALRLFRPPQARMSPTEGPLVLGLRRPTIILPAAYLTADRRTLRMMLAHELAHVRNRDLAWGWVMAAAELCLFFHPLVRWAAREWRLAQEMACDTVALAATGVTETAYGEMLVEASTQANNAAHPVLVAVGISESFTQLSRRLRAMTERTHLTRRQWLTLSAVLGVLLAAVFIPWRLAAQDIADTQKTMTVDQGDGSIAEISFKTGEISFYRLDPDGTRTPEGGIEGEYYVSPERIFDNAVEMGNGPIVRALLERAPSHAPKGKGLNDAMFIAAIASLGNIEENPRRFNRAGVLGALLDAGADPNATMPETSETILHRTVQSGDLPMVKTLVARGATINTTMEDGATPLYMALSIGFEDVSQYLRQQGGKVTLDDSPFLAVVCAGRIAEGERLLTATPALLKQPDSNNRTPLQLAVVCGNSQVVDLLLQRGADPNTKFPGGMTPLLIAIRRGDCATTRYLLSYGADKNCRVIEECGCITTPLSAAISSERLFRDARQDGSRRRQMVALLLQSGVDPNATIEEGSTPLHGAASGYQDVVSLLLQYKANVNAHDSRGWTPLHVAAGSGQLAIAEILLAHGADVNAEDNAGKTPRDGASDEAMAKLLFDHGAKPTRTQMLAGTSLSPNGHYLTMNISERPETLGDPEEETNHVVITDLTTGKTVYRHQQSGGSAGGWHRFTGDGRGIYVANDKVVERVDLRTGRRTRTAIDPKWHITAAPDNTTVWEWKMVSNAKSDGTPGQSELRQHDIASGKVLRQHTLSWFRVPAFDVANGVFVDVDSTRDPVTKGISNIAFVIRDLKSGDALTRIPIPGDRLIGRAEFSKDGKRLTAIGKTNETPEDKHFTLTSWDVRTGNVVGILTAETNFLFMGGMVFSPDHRQVVSLTLNNEYQLWDMEKATVLYTLPKSQYQYTRSVHFTPDGKRLVFIAYSMGKDHTNGPITIVDARNGQVVKTLPPVIIK